MYVYQDERTGEIKIQGLPKLSKNELERFLGVLNGQWWVRMSDCGVEFQSTHEVLPPPERDLDMLPFWRPVHESELGEFERSRGTIVKCATTPATPFELDFSPGIIVQHLCGYYYTTAGYALEARKLQSYGFTCLRSQRGIDGRYDEVWLLPALWMAKGELKKFIEGVKKENNLPLIVGFLCNHVSFGSLDVSVQRAAMPIPED